MTPQMPNEIPGKCLPKYPLHWGTALACQIAVSREGPLRVRVQPIANSEITAGFLIFTPALGCCWRRPARCERVCPFPDQAQRALSWHRRDAEASALRDISPVFALRVDGRINLGSVAVVGRHGSMITEGFGDCCVDCYVLLNSCDAYSPNSLFLLASPGGFEPPYHRERVVS